MASEGLLPGNSLLQYRLSELLSDGGTGPVWKAEDAAKERDVSIKVLGAGPVRVDRAELTQQLNRLLGAQHATLAEIYEVTTQGPRTLVVREFAEGDSVASIAEERAFDRNRFLHLALQIARGLGHLHTMGMVHGNLRADNVIVNPRGGTAKLTGLALWKGAARNLNAPAGAAGLAHFEAREVYSLAPEVVQGGAPDARSDVFSFGTILYLLATGKQPFGGTTSAEVLSRIVQSPPANPQSLNPGLVGSVISILGKCLHKDPAKRLESGAKVLEELRREAGVLGLEEQDTTKVRKELVTREAIVLIAEFADTEEVEGENTTRRTVSLQQIVGETVYVFDGKIADPFAPRVIAEFQNEKKAIDAAKKSFADLDEHNREKPQNERLHPRIVIHSGRVREKSDTLEGPAVDLARGAAAAFPAGKIFVSQGIAEKGGVLNQTRPATIFSGVKFLELRTSLAPANAPVKVIPEPEAPIEEVVAEEEVAPVTRRPLKKKSPMPAVILGSVILAAAVGTLLFVKLRSKPPAAASVAPKRAAPAPKALPRAVVGALVYESSNESMRGRAAAIREAVVKILSLVPGVELVDNIDASDAIDLKVRDGATGPELVPFAKSSGVEGTAFALNDVGSATVGAIQWIARQTQLPAPAVASLSPVTVGAIVQAFEARAQSADGKLDSKQSLPLRGALKLDARSLPAQLIGLELFKASGDRTASIETASRIAELDPKNDSVVLELARWHLEDGNSLGALFGYRLLLLHDPNQVEALNAVGRYALAVGDTALFQKAVARLKRLSPGKEKLHDPDLLMAAGRIDAASQLYFDIETTQPQNASLALKIGRIAVLRRSLPIAEIELKKLETLDPDFGLHVLKAYIAAEGRKNSEVAAELALAESAIPVDEPFYTLAAELYAVLGDAPKAIAHLQKALSRGEPTMNYVAASPLFRFLESEEAFSAIRSKADGQKRLVAASLTSLNL